MNEKETKLLKALQEAEANIDFGSKNELLNIRTLIIDDPTIHAAYSQYCRKETYGTTEFLLTCVKLLYKQKSDLMNRVAFFKPDGN